MIIENKIKIKSKNIKIIYTVEFRGSYRFLSQIKALGLGQIEWASKKKSPVVRT